MYYDDLPLSAKADIIGACARCGIQSLSDIRTAYNRYLECKNIYGEGGLSLPNESLARAKHFGNFLAKGGRAANTHSRPEKGNTQQMQFGKDYWQSRAARPTYAESMGYTEQQRPKKQTVISTKNTSSKPFASDNSTIVEKVVDTAGNAINKVVGGAMYYGLSPFALLYSLFDSPETPEQRRERTRKENTADKPYTKQIDAMRNERRSEPSDPEYLSRLGMMGLVSDKRSENLWHLKDAKNNNVRECAKFANHFNAMIGKPTAGDAWTTKGIYGDSLIYGDTPSRSSLPAFLNVPRMLSKEIFNVERERLETGDIVDLYNPLSPYSPKASREGRGNSHTGRVYKPEGNNGPTYIIHNTGGNVWVEPLGNFLSPLKATFKITRIARPGTQNKPYANKEQR